MQLNKTLVTALAMGTALTGTAFAQGGMPGAGIPKPGAGRPRVPLVGGLPRPGMPMGAGHLPFASGAVTAVDAAAGTVTLTPMFIGAAPQTVRVTVTTQITAQKEAQVSDLKVGDTVQVRGVPTGITATQITAGEGSDPFMGGPFGGGMIRPGGANAAGMASAQASGQIASLNPLTITISEGVSVVLKIAPSVRVVKTVTETVGDLKVGDRLMANGQSGDDNVLTATRIHVNADYGMGGGRMPPGATRPLPMPQIQPMLPMPPMPQMPK